MKLRKLPSVDYTPTRAYITRDDLPDAARTTSSRPVRRSYALVSKRGRPAGTTRRSTRSGSSNAPEANVPAPVSGDSAGVRKRGRPRKDDQSAESTTAEPAIPEAASSPELLGRGRGRPGLRALGGHPVSPPPPKKRRMGTRARPETPSTPPVLSVEEKLAQDRRIAERNAISPSKSALKSRQATDSVEKKVKFAAGVKKAAPKTKAALKAKGNGNKPMSTQQLMFAFFRENRDSVKHLKFARQQKALGTLWKESPVNPKNQGSTDAEDNQSDTSEQPSDADSSLTASPSENDKQPDDVFTDEMDTHTHDNVDGASAGPSEWDTTDSSASSPRIVQDPMNPGVMLKPRPVPTNKYPDDDPDGIYYLSDEEDAVKKKKTRAGSRLTQRLKEVSVGGDAHVDNATSSALSNLDGKKGEFSGANKNEDGEAGDDGVQLQAKNHHHGGGNKN